MKILIYAIQDRSMKFKLGISISIDFSRNIS